MPVRDGEGNTIIPKGISEVRKKNGTLLWTSGNGFYDVDLTDYYGTVDGFDVTITDRQFTTAQFDVTITDQQFTA